MRTYKITFNKFRKKGQTVFSRSINVRELQLLLILSDDVECLYKKKYCTINFTFEKKEFQTMCTVDKVARHDAAKILQTSEWK